MLAGKTKRPRHAVAFPSVQRHAAGARRAFPAELRRPRQLPVQVCGLNILLDPVWSDRVSPFNFAGPKRMNPPGIAFDDLPPIDAMLITHNHYDHLDRTTVARVCERFGRASSRRSATIRSSARFRSADRRSRPTIGATMSPFPSGVSVHLEPAYHWSARCAARPPHGALVRLCDHHAGRRRALPHRRYRLWRWHRSFASIGEKYGAARVALLPIGAYEPRWYMRNQHVDPQEAVRIMLDCGAERAFGHHWGTFRLTQEPVEEPPQVLALRARSSGCRRTASRRCAQARTSRMDWDGKPAPTEETTADS